MRVDFATTNLEPAERSQTGRAGQTGPAANETSGSAGEAVDHTNFSFGRVRIQSLASQALAAPEIRQAKVGALGQAIAAGEYAVDATKVADAMTAEYSGGLVR